VDAKLNPPEPLWRYRIVALRIADSRLGTSRRDSQAARVVDRDVRAANRDALRPGESGDRQAAQGVPVAREWMRGR